MHPKLGYSLDYPDSWNVDWTLIGYDGPLEITNFPAGGYLHGGLLPPGGIDINVQLFPGTMDENDLLVRGAAAAGNVTRSVQAINHRGVLRADYDFHFTDSVTYRGTSFVVHVGDKLFTILVSYEHTPPSEQDKATGEAALSQIVTSLATGAGR
ncbi:MAG: hypothetical protein ACHQ9S_22910 [Candidatus Binatia bacterium]